jgi:hypothetical protein
MIRTENYNNKNERNTDREREENLKKIITKL